MNRGIALAALKRHDEALASYGKAIALNPGVAEAYNNRGNALQALNRPDEALSDFDTAIRLNPAFPDASSIAAIRSKPSTGWTMRSPATIRPSHCSPPWPRPGTIAAWSSSS